MKNLSKATIGVALTALMFGGILQGEDRDRTGTVRGMFVRLTEKKVGDQGYMGIVVKPFESDNHVTVLVPRNRKEVVRAARRFDEDARLDISFVVDGDHKWIRTIEAEMQREKHEEGSEDEERIIIRREVRRESAEDKERPVSRSTRTTRRDPEPVLSREREGRQERRPVAQLDQLQRQLREVVSVHLDRMSNSVREVMADHLWRMDAEFRELKARVDRIERQLEELRDENERLRRELRERGGPKREREGQARARRENQERTEREVRRNREDM